jgi:protein-L-isoaspartate O-methyltransferase
MNDVVTNTNFNTFDYKTAREIPEVVLRVELIKKRMELLRDKKNEKVLEIGVGSGDTTLMLANEFKSVLCIDIDQQTLDDARNRSKEIGVSNIEYRCGDITKDLRLDEKYDHIFLIGILEHLEDPVQVLLILSKYLSDNGTVYVLVNLANSLHRWLGVVMGDIEDVSKLSEADVRLGHHRVYDLKLLNQHISEAGMANKFQELFYVKPFPSFIMNDLSMKIHHGLNKLAERFPEFSSYVYLEVVKS